jgi:hypothetical protein
MNQNPFLSLSFASKVLRSIYKLQVGFKFLINNINWVLVYGPPRTGTSLLSRLLSYNSKFMIDDVGLHLIRKYPEAANWSSELSLRYYENTYFNLLCQSHEGTWFYKKPFLRPIDIVIKQASLQEKDYKLLCSFFGSPRKKYFCIREPSGYCSSHLKKFDQPNNVIEDYERAIVAYDKIGGEIIDYSSSLDLHTYEKILFGKILGIPTKLKYKEHPISESSLMPLYDEFKRKNKSFISSI